MHFPKLSPIWTFMRSTHVRLIFWTICLLLLWLTFRDTFWSLFYIIKTYLNWYKLSSETIDSKDDFDVTMASYPLNQTSAIVNYKNVVPAIIHQIFIGKLDFNKYPLWKNARDACLKWHPNYRYMFWNESSAEKFIQQEYPWFLDTWKSYWYPIQRADSLRYLVLYRYGGIFLDMDLHCRRSLGPLRRFNFITPAAYPIGVSNGFLMVSTHHPFMKVLVDNLPLFNHNFILPYATVMFSTGCMYLSAQILRYHQQYQLRLLDYKHHRLSGHISTPLFHHYGSSSWHLNDAGFIKLVDRVLNFLSSEKSLIFFLILLFMTSAIIWFYFRRLNIRI